VVTHAAFVTENLHWLVVESLSRRRVWRVFCSGSKATGPPTCFFIVVSAGDGADFKMQCSPELSLGGTAPLQIISFCTPRSAFLRHLYQSALSMTLSTVLSQSMSFSVFSDS